MVEKLLEGLRNVQREFFTKAYSTVVYGSHSYGIGTNNSDLDFTTIHNEDDFPADDYVNRCFEFYRDFGLRIATGVPHKNKLLINFETLESSLQGKGFLRDEKRIIIPEMREEDPDFLKSKEVIYRATLNALTGKPLYVCGDLDLFNQVTKNASESLVAFIFGTNNLRSFSPSEFVQAMMYKDEVIGGADYLGYKDKPGIRTHLIKKYSVILESLVEKGILEEVGNNFSVKNQRWYLSKIEKVPSII